MTPINQHKNRLNWQHFNGTRVVVAAFGIWCGLTGIIAGFFEILQGSIAPDSLVISYIGPNYSMADDSTYFAVTLIPNFLLTGILAIIVSSLVIIWSVGFVHKKYGVTLLFILSVIQMLVGGGWVIDLGIITCILATRINKPLNWWRSHLPIRFRIWLAKLFPFMLIIYSVVAISMNVFSILGVNNVVLLNYIEILAAVMFIPILLMTFGGLAQDIQKQRKIDQESEAVEIIVS
ncbi:MAG: hypothetical protein ACFFDI_20675 [Promethearchaeota archaeon]